MHESGKIAYDVPRDEMVKTMWKRMVMRRRYRASIGILIFFSLLLFGVGAPFRSAAVLLLLYAITRPLTAFGTVGRSVDSLPALRDPKTLEFNADGVIISGPDWQTRRHWRHFKGWGEDERHFYLDVTAAGAAAVIPKAAMNADQQALLRNYLRTVPTAPR
jgi:hypothetical protein